MSGNDYEIYLGIKRNVLSELSVDHVMGDMLGVEFKVSGCAYLSIIISVEDATMLALLHGNVDDFLVDEISQTIEENREYVGYGSEW
jgi:hypothetical protein